MAKNFGGNGGTIGGMRHVLAAAMLAISISALAACSGTGAGAYPTAAPDRAPVAAVRAVDAGVAVVAVDAQAINDVVRIDAAPVVAWSADCPSSRDSCSMLGAANRPECCSVYGLPRESRDVMVDAVPEEEPVQTSAFYCTETLYGKAIAPCVRDALSCSLFTEGDGELWGECFGVDRAACFKVKEMIDGTRGDRCFTKISTCQDLRKEMAKDQRDVKVLSKCKVTKR